jgi:hypothetical protein
MVVQSAFVVEMSLRLQILREQNVPPKRRWHDGTKVFPDRSLVDQAPAILAKYARILTVWQNELLKGVGALEDFDGVSRRYANNVHGRHPAGTGTILAVAELVEDLLALYGELDRATQATAFFGDLGSHGDEDNCSRM